MNNKRKCLATIMKKHFLEDNLYLYTFVSTVIGYKDLENECFIDTYGHKYGVIECSNNFDNSTYVSAQHLFFDEINSKYHFKSKKEFKDFLVDYSQINRKFMYLAFENPNAKKQFITIDTDKLKENYFKNYIKEDNYWKEIINNINNGFYSKEELLLLQQQIKDESRELLEVSNVISLKLINNYKSLTNITEKPKEKFIDVDTLFKKVTKTLIGQDNAAKRLIVEIARMDMDDDKKYGILLTGAPGVGKTLLLSLISEHLDRPFLVVDSTQLTIPGYTGKNIEQCLWELYEKYDGDLQKIEHAIIYFDEIDKKGSMSKDDISGQGVLNQLLKFLDGTTYQACANSQSTNTVLINTSKMLSIFGAAFTDVYNSHKNNLIGFNRNNNVSSYVPTINDFVEKAMMTPEFMRRVPIIIRMNDFDIQSFKRILLESDISPIKIQQKKFRSLGVKLSFTDNAYDAIAENANKLSLGASGLDGVVSEVTYRPFSFVLSNYGKVEEIIITKDTIKDGNNYKVKCKSR